MRSLEPLGEMVPVRTSPRITRNSSMQNVKSVSEDSAIFDTNSDSEKVTVTSSKEKSVLLDAGYSKTESLSFNQSAKLLQKMRGRKSLSRQVLEHNTLSRIMSTPSLSDKTISKETSDSKIEETLNSAEPKIPDNSNSCTTNSLVFDVHVDNDTSIESNISLDCSDLPDYLKMSDSLEEYMKSRSSKNDNVDQTVNEGSKIHAEESDIIKVQSKDTQIQNTLDEAKFLQEPMEIYEDLSSGAEDVEEVLTASKQEMDNLKVYAELSNCSENAFDELEKNIFEIESRKNSLAG
ncbi:hypothetical protein NQ314_004614 [Rhamnusium bicolor]|uniref:Uncharacterized protein n=1 Tax=Rhamnusium bicolor TaxID=1586634 RepID=A0AAV8ZJ03_9CUCU|nr:hypothetical protein NQ314_004614 [Rhamnusium bicolor]